MSATVRLLRLSSDDRLIEQLRSGSHAAFEAIYARHHRGVLSFCRHMLGSPEEAEDAVQHTFLEAYRDLVGSAKEIRLRPWLYAIARNRCVSVLRTRHERPAGALDEPAVANLAEEVERRHDLRAVLSDVSALPHEQRAALLLAEMGDLSHDDIGEVLGCPREKVKALVYQARSSLIASRTARETPCAEVREQIANLRGGSLRRNSVRRHLRVCPGCREYRDAVAAQRRALALVLPVAPTLGLKAAVLGGAGAAGTVAATGGGSGSLIATAAVAVVLVGGGTAAVRMRDGEPPPPEPTPTPAAQAPTATATAEPVAQRAKKRERPERRERRRRAPVQAVPTPAGDVPEATPEPVADLPEAEPEPEPEATVPGVQTPEPVTTPQPSQPQETATVQAPPTPTPTAADDDDEDDDEDGFGEDDDD